MTQLMDMWDRSILNLYASPLRQSEYVTGAIIFSFFRVAIGSVLLSVFVGVAFDFNILDVGPVLVPAFLILLGVRVGARAAHPVVRAALRVERRGPRVVAGAVAAAGCGGLLPGLAHCPTGSSPSRRRSPCRTSSKRCARSSPTATCSGASSRSAPRLDVVYLVVGVPSCSAPRTAVCGRGACCHAPGTDAWIVVMADGLSEAEVGSEPMAEVERWADAARAAGVHDWDAMVVATCDAAGVPSARVVLLRGLDQRGFCFYSSYESRKGRELAENPRAAIVLHWREQGRQVRAVGAVTRLTPEESSAYWRNRPLASRLSAWASRQSDPVDDRATLQAEVADVAARFGDADIPLPPFWGGYRVTPDEVELWQHRDDRLHDRIAYRRAGEGWIRTRLQP